MMRKILPAVSLLLVPVLLFSGCRQTARQLTQAQIDEVNEAFEPLLPVEHDRYEFIVNPVCHFLSSTYDRPEDLDFEAFIQYFSTKNMLSAEEVSEEEFELLKELEHFPFRDVASLGDMPVPLQRKPRAEIDAVLQRYAGITSDRIETGGTLYLGAPYDSFYTYTSDAGFGQFLCTGGEIKGDAVTLYSDNAVLTFQKAGDTYRIVSHQEK